MEEKCTEPYHTEYNPLEREMAQCKNDCRKIMIDQNVDLQVWFKVMEQFSYLHNQKAHPGKKIYLTLQKQREILET